MFGERPAVLPARAAASAQLGSVPSLRLREERSGWVPVSRAEVSGAASTEEKGAPGGGWRR